MSAPIRLSDEQAEAIEAMRALCLPKAYIARQSGLSLHTVSLNMRGYVSAPTPTALARRIARVERIRAHIAAMPGIPMTIASEAIE